LAGLLLASTQFVQALTDEEIHSQQSSIEQRMRENEAKLKELGEQRATLETAIAAFDAEIATLRDQIELTELKLTALRAELDQTRRDLEKQKGILRRSLREHYTFGDVRTIELLAESDSFSDFFDQQEYLDRIRSSIQDSAREVARLEKQLVAQELEQTKLLEDLQSQKTVLDQRRAEKNQLLQQTKGQQSLYDQQLRADQAEYQRLQNILAARQTVISGGTGNYPYPNACRDPYPPPWDLGECTLYHHWSYYDRQCTSWAYWRRNQLGKPVEQGWSNAEYWKDRAAAAGYQVSQVPKVGAVGVVYEGGSPSNHVYVVEEVHPDGKIIASQYNAYAANNAWGMYSLVSKTPAQFAGDWFIY
jgi:surface antigen